MSEWVGDILIEAISEATWEYYNVDMTSCGPEEGNYPSC